jgi:hypothetical protein
MAIDPARFTDPYRQLGAAQAKPVEVQSSPATNEDEFDFSFEDFLDIVNPLQHLPLMNMVYREISGDRISTPATIAGGALYGGVLGFAGAVLTAAYEAISGDTLDSQVSSLFGGPTQPTPQAALASYEKSLALAETSIQR